MTRRSWKVWLLCSLPVLALLLSTAVWAKNPALLGAGGSKKEEKAAPATQPSTNLTPGQVDHYLATLSDEQARQALAQKLTAEAAAKPSEAPESLTIGRAGPIGRLFFSATEEVSSALERLRTSSSRAAESGGTLSSAFETITGGKGAGQLVMSVLSLLAIIGAGLVAERVFIRAAEFKSVLLDEIKYGGVRAMDDSAMILRVKFKTLPRKQFVLTREVYHRLQRAFQENGIEFAQRNVTV